MNQSNEDRKLVYSLPAEADEPCRHPDTSQLNPRAPAPLTSASNMNPLLLKGDYFFSLLFFVR